MYCAHLGRAATHSRIDLAIVCILGWLVSLVKCYDKYPAMCVRYLISTPGERREAGHDRPLSCL